MKNYKQYFVKMQQNEFEIKLTPAELMVYLSIKSYLGNGKIELALSSRDIAFRTSLSQSHIPWITKKLIKKGLIRIIGKEGRRGGMCPIYQLITPGITRTNQVIPLVITKSKSSDQSIESSEQSSGMNSRGTKELKNLNMYFLNNLLKPISDEKLYGISLKLNIHVRHVRKMQKTILDKQANNELKRPYKNMERTLTNWLSGSISKRYLFEMDEVEKLDNATEEPQRKARFLKQIKQWEEKEHAN